MLFVPVVVTPTASPPTREAQELSGRVAEVVRQYRAEHPDLREEDVRDAMALATENLGAAPSRRGLLMALVLVALLALGVVYFVANEGGGPLPLEDVPWTTLAIGGLVVVLALARFLGRR